MKRICITVGLWLAAGFIASLIFVPDIEAVAARMFVGEQFHHLDGTVMAAGWAYVSGAVLNVDVLSQYGIGMPVILSGLAQLAGGFTYENMLFVMIGLGILYFVAWFFLLQRWLGSLALALAAAVFAIKMQMFHPAAYPFVFTYPSSTVIRYLFDIVFLWMLFGHIVSGRRVFLFGAALSAAIGIFHMTTMGLCLVIVFGAYLFLHLIIPHWRQDLIAERRDYIWFAVLIATVPVGVILLLSLTQGVHVWQGTFWHNMREFSNYFLNHFGTVPMFDNLRDRNYWNVLMGFVMPLTYLGTFLIVTTAVYFKKLSKPHAFAALIALYGAAAFHYYVGRSITTTYNLTAVTFVALCFYWISLWLARLPDRLRRNAAFMLVILAFGSLFTNPYFAGYPNIWNRSENPMTDPAVARPLPDGRSYFNHLYSGIPEQAKFPRNSLGETDERLEFDFKTDEELKEYYRREFDFGEDAGLIARLTKPDETVALISSFETRILMQANRRPFFYYFPLVISRLMRMRILTVTALYTSDQVKKTIGQIEDAKPEYIFVERVFLNPVKPDNTMDGFGPLMYYVNAHYSPHAEGRFLVGLKRNVEGL